MKMVVENKGIRIGEINVAGVASSSVFQIGDTETITCSSIFDTPPESLIIGPLVPLASQS
jgi:spore germination protein PD